MMIDHHVKGFHQGTETHHYYNISIKCRNIFFLPFFKFGNENKIILQNKIRDIRKKRHIWLVGQTFTSC